MRPALTLLLILLPALVAPAACATAAEAAPPPGGAACTGCHPASHGDVPNLGGRTASDITAAMAAFRSGARPATVMGRIAKGFTDAETAAIASWYAAQP